MALQFRPSQIGGGGNVPLPYTTSPMTLLWNDFCLILRSLRYVPGIVLPLSPLRSGLLDELNHSPENLKILAIHAALIVGQLAFIVSLPFCIMLPIAWFVFYFAAVILVNAAICNYLNGPNRFLTSRTPLTPLSEHQDEFWVFINGVSVG